MTNVITSHRRVIPEPCLAPAGMCRVGPKGLLTVDKPRYRYDEKLKAWWRPFQMDDYPHILPARGP